MWKNLLGYALVIFFSFHLSRHGIHFVPAGGVLTALTWWVIVRIWRHRPVSVADMRWEAERMMTYDERQREAQRRESCRPQNV